MDDFDPQFRARVTLHFRFPGQDQALRPQCLPFNEDGIRASAIHMEGIHDLYSVFLFSHETGTFVRGDELDLLCATIWPRGFSPIVRPGVGFRLWDRGYFADGIVLERFETGWES